MSVSAFPDVFENVTLVTPGLVLAEFPSLGGGYRLGGNAAREHELAWHGWAWHGRGMAGDITEMRSNLAMVAAADSAVFMF